LPAVKALLTSIELCDHKLSAVKPAERQRLGELRPISLLAALNLGELADYLPIASIEVLRSQCFSTHLGSQSR
jgi:hypothetical protein